jgi:hypothetical protein
MFQEKINILEKKVTELEKKILDLEIILNNSSRKNFDNINTQINFNNELNFDDEQIYRSFNFINDPPSLERQYAFNKTTSI